MPDNKDIRGPRDRARINVNEDYEVRYWCKALQCTKDELEKAVKSVGTSAQKVRDFMGHKGS